MSDHSPATLPHHDVSANAAAPTADQLATERGQFFHLMTDLAAVMQVDGYFRQFNDRWIDVLGYTREELLARPIHDLIHPDDIEASRRMAADLIAGRAPPLFENRYRTRDGRYLWLQWCSFAVPEQQIAFCVARDITEEKQRSLAMKEAAELNRQLIESSQDAVLVLDTNGRIASISTPGCRLMQLDDPAALIGRQWLDLWQASDLEKAHSALLDARAGKNGRFSGYCPTAKGAPSWWDVAVSPMFDEHGNVSRLLVMSRDITEQMRAQEILRQSEERYRVLNELLPEMIWMADSTGAVSYCNPHWYAYTGLGIDETLGRGWLAAVEPAHRDKVKDNWQEAAGTINEYEAEIPFRRASDGAYRWHLVRGKPVRNPQGAVQYWIGVGLDVHERRQAERLMTEAAERFTFLAESMPQKIFTATPGGEVDYFNRQWMTFTGLSFEEIRDWGWTQFIHPDDIDETTRRWEQAIDTGDLFEFENRFRRSDGQYRWHLSRAHPMRDADNRIVMWIGSNTDIHEFKAAETAVRMSEIRYRSLAMSTAAIVWSCTPELRMIEPMPSWESYTGQRFDDYRDHGWHGILPDEDREQLAAAVQACAGTTAGFEAECRMRRADGQYRLNIVCGVPVFDLAGNMVEWVGTTIDIHDQREAELQLAQVLANERAARSEAERIGRMKDEFLTTLSHELRTPLNAIFGWAQILKRKKDEPDTLMRGIDTIDRNVRIQTRLIDDLLDMSAIVSGKIRLEVQQVDMVEVINAAIESIAPAAAARQVRVETILDTETGPVSGDANRLQQVLWNLLTNAVKFTPKGGEIVTRLERVASHVEISVSDSGQGIAPDFLPYVFERFSQADASITRQHSGLGIGLSIVRSLVDMHGGTIAVRSDGLGQGATFVISLPLRAIDEPVERRLEAAAPAAAAAVTYALPALGGIRALIVDDEADARDLVQHLLDECGATTASAASTAEALALLQTMQPDIIVCDIGMPQQDGYEFIRLLRKRGVTTPAISLTAFARTEDRVRSLQAGYQAHLTKPVEPSELFAVVASLTGRY